MIRKKLLTLVAASAMVATIQTAQAAFTDTLANLVANHGSLTIGDKTFSNFGYVTTGAPLGTDPGNLVVTASGADDVYGLTWTGIISVNNIPGSTTAEGDLALTYTVTVNDPSRPIWMIDQNYTPNGIPVGDNQISIGETVKEINQFGAIVGNSTLTLVPTDLSDPAAEAGDNLYFSKNELQLYVTKDIAITAAAGQIVGLSVVAQSFHEVPEPTTMIAGALLLLPFGASTLRILRKKQTA